MPELYGYYIQESGTIGSRSFYKSVDGKFAIWYKEAQWMIGNYSSLDTTTSHAFVSSTYDCPNDTGNFWRYYNNAVREWYDAYYSLTILSRGSKTSKILFT